MKRIRSLICALIAKESKADVDERYSHLLRAKEHSPRALPTLNRVADFL